ncbi:restriction endonuclease subunit M [Actinoalloteichus sp. AHMU CJ021]|uniref:type I restriction-modification system subunit M n=1 Tax=Actinoalloteichus sp. AHMU CJ021 TaxID=2072503 RepID=UPI000CA038CF|nr:restriction endonuclease subunit M [Actinoalloteichus sp. AHMU CJ021]
MDTKTHNELANHAWSVADLLRGDYKQSDYGKVILPFTVLRRLECVLAPTRDKVLDTVEKYRNRDIDVDTFLRKASGRRFYNITPLTLKSIAADSSHVASHLTQYIGGFSRNAYEVLERYDFAQQIKKLDSANLLYKVISTFADLDLRPEIVDNHQMGYIFEELIRRFAEQSNETAGEHFTPREVIELMVNLLIAPDDEALSKRGVVRRVLDPACGTGGMLSAAYEHITGMNPDATVEVHGQELNPESWAICRSDLMIKDQNPDNIKFGNSFSDDGHRNATFDYLLANPPFGVEWKKVKEDVEDDLERLGENSRFWPALPRINDGSLLFLQHMLSKMKPAEDGGGRVAIVFNGSPLFTGAAGSGESRIRQHILENDWLEGIVALPDQLFYNTGISTYFWILTNRKGPDHRGKVVLLDARDQWRKMRKSLGDKRKYIDADQISEITRLYADALHAAKDENHPQHAKVRVFANEDFGYRRITVERPLKLRFEISDDTLAALREAKPIQKLDAADEFVEAVRPLLGTTWWKKAEAVQEIRQTVTRAGLTWPTSAPFAKALRAAIGVRDPEGEVQTVKGDPEPDPELRDYENVPLHEDIEEYLRREVLPHVPDAWIDHTKTRIGYEIPVTRHFYVYEPPRPLAEIDAELKALEAEIQALLGEVAE